jgi:hypothetical protein
MHTLPRVIVVPLSMSALLLVVARDARAQTQEAPPTEQPAVQARERPPELDHRFQTGIAVMPGIGYRVVVPYAEMKDCGDSSGDSTKRVCTNNVPFFMDFQISFGVSRRLDLIADFRVGIDKDNDLPGIGRQFAFAPGLRVWLDQDVQLKFFTTVQLLYDQTEQGLPDIKDSDFGIRNSNGLMYDPIRNVGFYFQFGESIGFRRWFRIELDLGLGVQVRFP